MSLGWEGMASDVSRAVKGAGGRNFTDCSELYPDVVLGIFARLLFKPGSVPSNRAC